MRGKDNFSHFLCYPLSVSVPSGEWLVTGLLKISPLGGQ